MQSSIYSAILSIIHFTSPLQQPTSDPQSSSTPTTRKLNATGISDISKQPFNLSNFTDRKKP
jgi:hypothetical protein